MLLQACKCTVCREADALVHQRELSAYELDKLVKLSFYESRDCVLLHT